MFAKLAGRKQEVSGAARQGDGTGTQRTDVVHENILSIVLQHFGPGLDLVVIERIDSGSHNTRDKSTDQCPEKSKPRPIEATLSNMLSNCPSSQPQSIIG